MANWLYRLGHASYRHRGAVVAAWLLLVLGLLAGAGMAGQAPAATLSIPGTESQAALDDLNAEFPQASGASGTIAVHAPPGETLTGPQGAAVIAEVVADAAKLPGVVAATDPFTTGTVSRDGRYALVTVAFDSPADALSEHAREAYGAIGDDAPAGWTVAAGGEPLTTTPEAGPGEAVGVAIALLVLVVTFGSLVAAGMTLLNALAGVAVGMASIVLFGHVFDMSQTAPTLALMLGLAVGIDYSLFITSRYRHNIAVGHTGADAAGRAVATAGSAVVFAGLTVIIALSGLAVVGIPFLTVMGLAAAGTVAVAVLVAVTLLPAVLSFAGDRVLSRRQRLHDRASASGAVSEAVAPHEDLEESPTAGGVRWGAAMVRHRVLVLFAGVAALIVVAIPALSMQLALPDDGTAPAGTSKRIAYDLTSDGFGPGFNGRLLMVVSADDPDQAAQAATHAAEVAGNVDGVAVVAPPQPNADATTLLVAIIPETGPSDEKTVTVIRDLRAELADADLDADVALTGVTAIGVDISDKLADALPVYLLVVIGLSFVLLAVVFRSVLVPLKATAGFLLTIAATFGATVAVFQWGWGAELLGLDTAGPLISFMPILAVGILFGLAMDYEVFLVSRMREDFVHGHSAADAIVSGVGHGARVVVAAALIMVAVFSGFVLIDDPVVKSIGFALAVGVAFDAFIVRLMLVPAFLSLIGDKAWWLPAWLERTLPSVDIEGAHLNVDDVAAEQTPSPHA